MVKYLSHILFLWLLCSVIMLPAFAQQKNYALSTLRTLTEQGEKIQDTLAAGISSKEILSPGLALIRFYQYFISSQDRPSCMFSKSCSNFGLAAINKKGYLLGIMMTADRLQRCDRLAHEYYLSDPQTGLAIDPVPEYFIDNRQDDK